MDSASTNELIPGGRFGRFRVVSRLAVGGTAELFLAEEESSGRSVVLKVPIDRSSSTDALEHEAAIGGRLVHPSIVRVEGIERSASTAALVVEFVDGVPLAALVGDQAIDRATALRIVVTLAEALDSAHEATDPSGNPLALVHRDVNPHNVLVSRSGDVKLLDFGIARSTLAKGRTRTGSLKGTLRYLAPEQATGSDVDRRTDVYALGLLGFELLEGEPFLRGDGDLELLRAAESPPRLEDRTNAATNDHEAYRSIGKALSRFPEERFGTARAFAKALVAFAADETTTRTTLAALVLTRVGAPPASAAARASGPISRSTARFVAVALACVASIGLAGFLVTVRGNRMSTDASAASRATAQPPERASRPHADVVTPASVRVEPPGAPEPTSRADATRSARVVSRAAVSPTTGEQAPEFVSDVPTSSPAVDPSPPDRAQPTRESVRGKLARTDARLRDARASGTDVRSLESISRQALEAYVDGRYEDADHLLDRILARLP